MNIILGIDVGGSTTKIVGLKHDGTLLSTMMVRAYDQITSLYGALGNYINSNGFSLSDVDRIYITGVGASYLVGDIYGIPTTRIEEFSATARGGLALANTHEAVVVSMGTGTAFVYANRARGEYTYLGGTGVGGGTLIGLSRLTLGMDSVEHIEKLCEGGDLSKIDLRIKDISNPEVYPDIKTDLTAANFGNLSDLADKHDIALGIVNMVAETIAMLSIFAARGCNLNDVVLTGNLTQISPICEVFASMRTSFSMHFTVPNMAQFSTVIGAALHTI